MIEIRQVSKRKNSNCHISTISSSRQPRIQKDPGCFLLSYLACSQNWLNQFLDGRHLGYITKSLNKTLIYMCLCVSLALFRYLVSFLDFTIVTSLIQLLVTRSRKKHEWGVRAESVLISQNIHFWQAIVGRCLDDIFIAVIFFHLSRILWF